MITSLHSKIQSPETNTKIVQSHGKWELLKFMNGSQHQTDYTYSTHLKDECSLCLSFYFVFATFCYTFSKTSPSYLNQTLMFPTFLPLFSVDPSTQIMSLPGLFPPLWWLWRKQLLTSPQLIRNQVYKCVTCNIINNNNFPLKFPPLLYSTAFSSQQKQLHGTCINQSINNFIKVSVRSSLHILN